MTKEEQTDSSLKIVLIGDSGTGKTSLLTRLISKTFDPTSKSTTGVNFDTHQIQIKDNNIVNANIWDLAGGQKYRALTELNCQNASGVFLVYDISNYVTFKNIGDWLKLVRPSSGGDSKIKMMLIGNKSDLDDSRAVPTEEAQAFADDNDLVFFETSAFDGGNVELTFLQMALISCNNTQQKPFHVVLVDIKAAAKNKIHCVEKPLQDNLKFITLSYRWGELQESLIDTQLGYIASVKSFYMEDFYRLCEKMGKDPDLKDIEYVWVDAICVDQTNYDRRKATIYHMSEIYEHAKYIIAVPDLHLQHLKNISGHNMEIMHDIGRYEEYIYYLIHGNYEELHKMDQSFLDIIQVPKDPTLRRWLTHSTEFFTNSFIKYKTHHSYYEPVHALDHLCRTIQISSNQLPPTPNTTYIILQKEEIWKKTLGDNNNDLIDDPDNIHYCNEPSCPLDYSTNSLPPWRDLAEFDQGPYIQGYYPWKEKIVKRHTIIQQAMEFFMDAIKDWSTRVWVISEYSIAKKKNNLKYWFIQIHNVRNHAGEKIQSIPFYKFDFDNPVIDPFEKTGLPLNDLKKSVSNPVYQQFHELIIKQLNEQTFLEMMLKSKASRHEDRFYAVLPMTQYKEEIKNKDVVSSWQIETMVSVKLKLYEWMTTKEKLNLFFLSGHMPSVDFYPIIPTFATSNIIWEDEYVPYPPMDAFSSDWNFDLSNSDSIQLILPNKNNSHMYYLNVKPKVYYRVTDVFRNDYFKKRFTECDTLCKRFQLDNPNDLDIIGIPPFEAGYMKSDNYFYYLWNIVVLIGTMKRNKWEIHQLRYSTSLLDWKYYSCDEHCVGFNIY